MSPICPECRTRPMTFQSIWSVWTCMSCPACRLPIANWRIDSLGKPYRISLDRQPCCRSAQVPHDADCRYKVDE